MAGIRSLKVRRRRRCGWGENLCREPATAGRFGPTFCAEHAVLAAITVPSARARKASAVTPPNPPVERIEPAEPQAPRCQVVGCGAKAKPTRPVCGRHKNEDLPATALAAYEALKAARPREKPGRKPKVAA